MSDLENDDSNLPSAAECDRRCKEFAAITQTDCALAMFFLQDREWNLELSVSDYFQSIDLEKFGGNFDALSSLLPANVALKDVIKSPDAESKSFVDPEPHRIRVMSWNIDGLDSNNVKSRAKAACKTIINEKPDVVFLQEVVLKNLEVIKDRCPNYTIIYGTPKGVPHDNGEYFTVVLLQRTTTEYLSHSVQPFFSSIMSRTLLQVGAKVKGISFQLITSHLESTSSQEAERLRQLKMGFSMAEKVPENQVVIFGGDLNLRDSELEKVGGLPDGLVDLWEDTGRRPEAEYTWDMQKNDNIGDMRSKPRRRFDRMYCNKAGLVNPVYFELVGFHRDEESRRFPSDHWGIMAHFNKIQKQDAVDG